MREILLKGKRMSKLTELQKRRAEYKALLAKAENIRRPYHVEYKKDALITVSPEADYVEIFSDIYLNTAIRISFEGVKALSEALTDLCGESGEYKIT
jgi:hypothetical protein